MLFLLLSLQRVMIFCFTIHFLVNQSFQFNTKTKYPIHLLSVNFIGYWFYLPSKCLEPTQIIRGKLACFNRLDNIVTIVKADCYQCRVISNPSWVSLILLTTQINFKVWCAPKISPASQRSTCLYFDIINTCNAATYQDPIF